MTASTAHLTSAYLRERVAIRSIAPTTLSGTRYTLASYVACVPADPRTIRPRHVTRWMAGLDVAPSTMRNRLSTVRTFSRWMVLHDHTSHDPTLGVRSPTEPSRLPRALACEDVGRLLHHCPDARARLIVCLMVELGLRRAEVTSVEVGDLDRRAGLLLVRGKGSRERWLPLTTTARSALDGYLAEHPATTGPLVRSYVDPHLPITPAHAGRLVVAWMRSAGVKVTARDGVSAHALRRTCASDVLDGGADIRQVQTILGHANLRSLDRYLRRPDAVALRAVMEGRRYSEDLSGTVEAARLTAV